MRSSAHRTSQHEGIAASPRPFRRARAQLFRQLCTGTNFLPPTRERAWNSPERGNMSNATTPALNPNPPKLVTGAQLKAARALLGWRRIDLAAAAGLHRNAVAYWEGQSRMPRREPFACRKMRAALLSAGVVTVSTPAPGVCLLSAGCRSPAKPFRTPGPMAPNPEGDGHRLITASNGPELCAMHNDLAVSTAPEQGSRSSDTDGAQGTETSEARE